MKHECNCGLFEIFVGDDEGPLLTIIYTVEESNGSCKRLCLPFSTLAPKDPDTGELLSAKLKENTRTLCLYPHNNTYYEAMILKVGRKKKQRQVIKNLFTIITRDKIDNKYNLTENRVISMFASFFFHTSFVSFNTFPAK